MADSMSRPEKAKGYLVPRKRRGISKRHVKELLIDNSETISMLKRVIMVKSYNLLNLKNSKTYSDIQ